MFCCSTSAIANSVLHIDAVTWESIRLYHIPVPVWVPIDAGAVELDRSIIELKVFRVIHFRSI